MHKPILDGLEDFLSGRLAVDESEQFSAHLAQCAECRTEVEELQAHAELMHLLRAPSPVEPAPGFYARVMDRIESQSVPSLWSIFLEPVFGRRLMVASLSLFVLLASAVWQTRSDAPLLEEHNPVTVLATYEMPAASGENPQQDRDVVFANLASFGGGQSVHLLPVSSD